MTMIFAQAAAEAGGYVNRYAAAVYMGGSNHPPRSGLVQRQYYAGQILEHGQFRVLKPARLCSVAEFYSYQLVSKRWCELTEAERALLVAVYNQRKLPLESLPSCESDASWDEVASRLSRVGYLRRTDEPNTVELTLVGEAEVEHQIANRGAGDNLLTTHSGIRLRHHSAREHEIDLARGSTLAVNVDGMLIRIFTLPTSGVVVRVDHDESQRVHMSHTDAERHFTQAYIDRIASLAQPEAVRIGEDG
jgi:hypothetical protein